MDNRDRNDSQTRPFANKEKPEFQEPPALPGISPDELEEIRQILSEGTPLFTDAKFSRRRDAQKPPPSLRYELFEWAHALVTSLIIVGLLFAFAGRLIGVVGSSMEPTLYKRERILISNLFYTPKQGDIIVFSKKDLYKVLPDAGEPPSFFQQFFEMDHSDRDEPLVKRVIATEGQTVDINFETNEVFVEGIRLEEPYIMEPTARQGDITYPYVVPENHVFVMGDNRNASADSRMAVIGAIDRRYILGRALLRVWPVSKLGVIR